MRTDAKTAVLESIEADFRTNLVIMRWLRFLMEKMDRKALPQLFSYYQRIGWISKKVEEYLVQVSEGTSLPRFGEEETYVEDEDVDNHTLLLSKQPVKEAPEQAVGLDWLLSPEDHIKSWMFITELKGDEIDKNVWNELEQRMDTFEFDIESYYRV